MIGQGDYLQAQVNYTQGALRYVFQTPNSNWGKVQGQDEGFGVVSDAVYGGNIPRTARSTATRAQSHHGLERQRGLRALLEPALADIALRRLRRRQPQQRQPSILCLTEAAGFVSRATDDWTTWWLGSRTQWNVTKDFYLGVDVMYANLNSIDALGTAAIGGATHVSDVDNWQFRFRVHRDFYP